MNTIRFEIIKDIESAQKYWELLSPHKNLYDEWDFRYCFYKYFNYDLFFYVGFIDNKPIGLLPLQYTPEERCLEFFGGDYMENNNVFISKELEHYIPQFYKQLTGSIALLTIKGTDPFTTSLDFEDNFYYLHLKTLHSFNDYIEQYLSGDTKRELKRHIRKIELLPIEVIKNHFEDIELMFEQNKEVFGEDSWFEMPYMKEIFRDLTKLSYPINFLTYKVHGVKEGTSFSILYKNQYMFMSYSSNKKNIPNFGKYIILKTIDNAITHGAEIFDASMGDCNWKETWQFSKEPRYEFYK